jgi:hypothetical protein
MIRRCADDHFPGWFCHRMPGHEGPCALRRWPWWRRLFRLGPVHAQF